MFSEPPLKVHPVALTGGFIGLIFKPFSESSGSMQFAYGVFAALLAVALFTAPIYFLLDYFREASTLAFILVGAIILKPSFCIKQQWQITQKIKRLSDNWKIGKEPEELRTLMGTVSKNGKPLSRDMIVSASLRSLSENACDFVIAPLFYFLILGVPGAVGYRIINTLDSMVGSHGRYEYLGKFAARLDDVVNYIPARITAFLFVIAAFFTNKNWRLGISTALRDHAKPASPNGGWPMAAFAGALEISLEKAGSYKLGGARKTLDGAALKGGIHLFQMMVLLSVVCCVAVMITVG